MKIYPWARNQFSGLKSHICKKKGNKKKTTHIRLHTKLTLLGTSAKMTNRDSLAKHYTSCQIFLFGKFYYKLDKNACYLFKRSLVFAWESLIGLKGSLPPATLARADGLLFPHLVQLEGYSSRDPWPLEHMNNFRTEHCTTQFYFLILFNPLLSGSCKHVLWIKVATCTTLRGFSKIPQAFPLQSRWKI